MALLKELTLDNGIVLHYHRVSAIKKNGSSVDISTEHYASGEYREENRPICGNRYSAEAEGDYSFSSAYAYLKTLPEYEGAEDI